MEHLWTTVFYCNWITWGSLWSGIYAKNWVFVTASWMLYYRISFRVVKSNFLKRSQNRCCRTKFQTLFVSFREIKFRLVDLYLYQPIFISVNWNFPFFLSFWSSYFSFFCCIFPGSFPAICHFTKWNECSYIQILFFNEVS